jgi:hypothetical protein
VSLRSWAWGSFFVLWAGIYAILPYDYAGADTLTGDDIQQVVKALGATITIWSPIFGTLYALRWWRRKTH